MNQDADCKVLELGESERTMRRPGSHAVSFLPARHVTGRSFFPLWCLFAAASILALVWPHRHHDGISLAALLADGIPIMAFSLPERDCRRRIRKAPVPITVGYGYRAQSPRL